MSKETEMILEALKDLQGGMTELKQEMSTTKTELQGEIGSLKKEMSDTRTELQGEIGLLKKEMTLVKDDITSMKGDISSLKNETTLMKSEMTSLKNQTKSIKVILENVTNRHLKTIAEGHCDLSRKLDEAIKGNVDEEQLLVRVGLLEDDVRLLKEKVNTIA